MKTDKVQYLQIDTHDADRRIDNFLMKHLKGLPKSRLYRLLRKGEIRVNKRRIKPDYRLQAGDVIRLAPIRLSEPRESVQPRDELVKSLSERILYEDELLLIINKPAGMAVHGGSEVSLGLIEALRFMKPEEKHLELAHRLDKATSGCIMLTKKPAVLRELHELLRNGEVKKEYLALTMGHWPKKVNLINTKLRKNVMASGERIVRVVDEGKESLTEFHIEEKFQQASLMRVKLLTGRTHQIRVHAQFSGHPVAGDGKYGDRAFNQIMKRDYGLKRLFLHASDLSFRLKGVNKTINITAPLDLNLKQVLEKGVKT